MVTAHFLNIDKLDRKFNLISELEQRWIHLCLPLRNSTWVYFQYDYRSLDKRRLFIYSLYPWHQPTSYQYNQAGIIAHYDAALQRHPQQVK